MKNLNFQAITKAAKTFQLNKDDSYLVSYPHFLAYFKALDEIQLPHLVIASHFVYGWMPTILDLNLSKKEEVLGLLNKVKNEDYALGGKELGLLKSTINNSLVGVSKLLHFINPQAYAIWDSRIIRFVTGNSTSYGIDDPEKYLEYLKGLRNITSHEDYPALHQQIEQQLPYQYTVTPFRATEMIMFEAHKRTKVEKVA